MQVTNYDLTLDIDFQKLTFKGDLRIKLSTDQEVVLDSVGLNVLSVASNGNSFRFRQNEENLTVETGPFVGVLEVKYTGRIPNSLAGIYRAPYDHTHIVTTHFEAAQARRMLPCLDHPDAKAEFTIAVKIDNELTAISNMPVESVVTDGNRKLVTFQKSPRMSTYLLYLGVGRFEERTEKHGQVSVILATTPGKVKHGEFSLDEAANGLKFFESYYAIPYGLPKIHLIAVPEFAMGAMENWGAMTFRESALLIDANSSTRSKKTVALAVDHELAHQWFGNLVTMKWWDDIWLNESFASFMAYKAVDALHPDWKVWEDFLRNETAGAMARDQLNRTHPIQVPVKSPDEIEQIFDAISYGKGASILRMIEAYIGEEAFQRGIRQFLSNHAYSNATGEDLWNSLEAASSKKAQKIMSEWIRQPGYPVLTAEMKGGKLTLRQERFLISGSSTKKNTWPIPISMEVNGQSRNFILDSPEETLETIHVSSLKINLLRTGFYMVHYHGSEDLFWKSELSPIDKWGVLSDAFALLLAGKMTFTEYMKLLERFTTETEYLPTHEVSEQLSLLYTISPSRVSDFSRTFHQSQLEILRDKKDENGLILRGAIAGRLTLVDENYAGELAYQFKDYMKVPPDMKQAVTLAYARSTGDFEGLLASYRKTNSDEDRIRFLTAMTALTNDSLVKRTMDFTLSGEVKRQDVRTVLLAATDKPGAKSVTWNWLQDNIERLRKLYENTGTLSGTFLHIIPILGIGRVKEVEKFFTTHKFADAEVGISAGLEKLQVYDRLVRSIG